MTGSETPQSTEAARPLVASPGSNRAPWIFGGVLAVASIGLFSALEARRAELSSPAIAVPAAERGRFASPPELAIPHSYDEAYYTLPLARSDVLTDAEIARAAQPEPLPAPPRRPVVNYAPSYGEAPPYAGTVQPTRSEPVILRRPQPEPQFVAAQDPDRARASRFANPATTVPKGTVIHAVMETALDSNRAGFARAIVSRNVRSFDGTRLLVPKGSKLLGEYEADLNHGQNRALIQWHRLMLPDGTIIDVDSPSADSLGRAGVKGKVNSHFFARFGGAILQSALDIGVQLATREAGGDTLIFGSPIGGQEKISQPADIKPTLTIKQGSSVAVFVARDLDFTDVMP